VTIAHLLVKLGAETAEFHQQMERAARRTERTGRVFTKIGREISQAISLPLIAGAFGAFHVLLADSAKHFGTLFRVVESLKAELHDLFLAIGTELQPVFLQIIGLLRGGIAILQGWLAAFHELPEPVRKAVIFTLAFLAALGPTLFVVGKLITAIGALGRILPLLVTPMGLAVIAVAALAAAAIYVVTHWDWAKLKLALAWAFIVDLFFQGVRASILALDILTMGITYFTGISDVLRKKLDELADRTLGKLGATILQLEEDLKKPHSPMQTLIGDSLKLRKILQDAAEATRQLIVNQQIMGPTFDDNAVQAQILTTKIQALIAAGVGANDTFGEGTLTLGELVFMLQRAQEHSRAFGEALGAFGPRLEQQLRAAARFRELLGAGVAPGQASAAVVAEGQIIQTAMQGLVDSLTTIAERIGQIFGGIRQGFRGFAAQMGALLGAVLTQIGKTLIQMGTAAIAVGVLGKAIKFFAKNPLAAIAAGAALVALGSALAASSQRTLNAGLGGGGGGAAESAASVAAAPAEDQGTLILRLDSNFRRLNPEFVDIIAQALQEAKSRNVIIEEGD